MRKSVTINTLHSREFAHVPKRANGLDAKADIVM